MIRPTAAAGEATADQPNELTQSIAILRATLDCTADGILAVDNNGNILASNEQFAAIWGLPPELHNAGSREALLEHATAVLKAPEEFLERTRSIYSSDAPESFDTWEFKDGRVIERSSKIQRVRNQIIGRVWSFRDVTERRRAETALRDQAQILELLNNTGTAIAGQLDLQTIVQIVTDAATKLTAAKFGAFFYNITDENGDALMLYTLSGAPPEAFEKFGHPRATALFGPTFRGEGPIRSDDILQDARYGTMPPHHGMPKGHLPVRSYLAMPVISRSGDVIGGLFFGHPDVGVFKERSERIVRGVAAQAAIAIDNARLYAAAQRELSQRRKAEADRERLLVSEKEARERAERETRMKDEFLATLSHELRTPLNAILGWANILRESATPEEVAEGVQVIERNARAQTQIIDDLLDMSRIVSGNVRLDVQRVDLVPLIKSAMDSVKPMAAAKNIRVTSVLDTLAGAVLGDPARLQQVLWNILVNALKFTPKGGKVHAVLERVNSHLELSIADNGQGIAPDFLPHVFDRFRQADASITRSQRGLGLGLAIVKNLVELHGGSVRAKSPGVGQGATFIVTLPIAAAKPETQPHSTGVADNLEPARDDDDPLFKDCDLHGVRVLAVDDEADARDLVKRILARCGATVDTAGSVAEALEALRTSTPDVLVTDIGMPGEDGYALIRKVRQLTPAEGGNVPAIALTAFARSEDRRRAILGGFQMHMAKPVEAAELIAMVTNLAKRTG
jgi:PAS domain S-box-containing protein